jgi:hypothetical protein
MQMLQFGKYCDTVISLVPKDVLPQSPQSRQRRETIIESLDIHEINVLYSNIQALVAN